MVSATTDRRLGLAGNTAYKVAATALAAGNLTLSGEQTVGGVACKAINAAGVADRVLCTGQSDATKNGLWDVSTGSWTRSVDANGNYDWAQGTQVLIGQGTYAFQIWALTTANPITVGTTALTFSQSLSAGFLATLAASAGASLVGWVRAATGAIATTVANWLGWQPITVFEFMTAAQIADVQARTASIDVTAAIQAAATAAGYGGTLIFPPGTYLVSSTITLRGATKMLGSGVELTIIYRTGDYGDTFVCGTAADQSEPARSFEARKIRFQHSVPFVGGGSTIQNKATSGAHIRLRGAQEAKIIDCWFFRLPNNLYCEGGSWVKVQDCQFIGVYDQSNVAVQEGVTQLAAVYSAVHGNPTTWEVTGCNFLGATIARNITYVASSGNQAVNRIDTIGPLYGFYINALEDLVCTGNYFGGQSVAEIAVLNAASGGVIDLRIAKNFFDGISQGQGILFAPTIANMSSLAVTIEGNVFTDNYHAVFINQNTGSSTPSVYDLTLTGNVCLSGIATQFLLNGVKGFTCSSNSISDYNKHAISSTDATYTTAILAYGVTASGTIQGNTVGGGGNTLLNTTGTNFCYAGISVASTITSVTVRNNSYTGIRSGSNFLTGTATDESQTVFTTTGNYQMTAADSVFVGNKAVGASTAVNLPPLPVMGREAVVKDGKGDAATNTVIVGTSDGSTIDGAASINITTAYGFMRFRFNGTQWNRIG